MAVNNFQRVISIKKITTLPGTIKITKESYVEYMKKDLMRSGCSEEQSIKLAEKDYDRIIANKEKRIRKRRE